MTIKFLPLKTRRRKQFHTILSESLGNHTPLYATVKIYVAQLKRGDFSTRDAPRPGLYKTVSNPEIIDQIHELTFEDCRIFAKSITEPLSTSCEIVGSISHNDLDMWKLSALRVPKWLNAKHKRQRCQSSAQIWIFSA